MPSLDDPLLIFTDIEGTLLDSHTGEWQPAAEWLARLRQRKIPVILCSSKTAAEMIAIQNLLQLQGLPFIAENGAVIQLDEHWQDHDDYPRIITGSPHAEIARVLTQLRQSNGWKFTTFTELDEHVLAELTGLTPAQANLAKLQEASETLIWRDSDERMAAFDDALAQLGLRVVQGARFWHVLDERGGKDQAVSWLTRQYRHYQGKRAVTVGLGDGPNDAPLLDNVDYAVVVKGLNRQGVTLRQDSPPRVYHTQHEGAAGWREGLDHLFGISSTEQT
ncbi:mannosyl-3-phosphoglycerate phosphatase-related protein [Kosakonia pseudosacchari]|uniref:mannosyl-3-phosphoglycerate phosphatase-related protein n=1 Tax=Kosakonia pseudosacchari TaxID=1646340 RepID=UPI0022F04290|nr:mannosyl-3-phosphoglycerate phosphatase-related protein [Kosakonia pseudosacchari]WBU51054.1 mannosyl-3-phosphoglycerate phosphatase-related protein [Kosakonia pseudosacchari]